MKKFTLTLTCLAASLMASANPIDLDKAQEIASQFLTSVKSKQATNKHYAPAKQQLVSQEIGFNNLYTFTGENGGFVIMAADDRVKDPVLAYSTTGTLDLGTMPLAMQAMLQSYEEQIASMSAGSAQQQPILKQPAIAPLIQTTWTQNLPLAYYAPIDKETNETSAVGCVAVTLGQLMYYYQYPTSTTVTIPAYQTVSGFDMQALPPTTFNYSKIKRNYWSIADRNDVDGNDESVKEVAKLLLYAGCALQMQYSPYGSSSNFEPDLIAKYFGYDKKCRKLMAANYPHTTWEEMVYNELKAGRPVPYSASAHMFIIDGYDGNGFFHANIGQSGNETYYRLGVLNDTEGAVTLVKFSGYNIFQAGYFGFQPDKGGDALAKASVNYGDYALPQTDFTRSGNNADFEGVTLKAKMERLDKNGKKLEYGWGLYQYGLLKKELSSATTDKTEFSIDATVKFGKGLADGTYQIFPIYRNSGATEWEYYSEWGYTDEHGTPQRHFTATISNNKLQIAISSREANLTIDKIHYFAAYVGEKLDVRANITNNGTNYENRLFLWIDGKQEAFLAAYVDPGMSDYVDFCTAAPEKGTHELKISTDEDGKNVIFTDQLTITDPPVCKLKAETTVKGIGDDGNIHDDLVFEHKITNKGTTTFDNMVIATMTSRICDSEGKTIRDEDNHSPGVQWRRAYYLHLEPGESKVISHTIRKHDLKGGNIQYHYYVVYYNKGDDIFDDGFPFLYSLPNESFVAAEETGISAPAISEDKEACYDLQGRRINADNLTPGIYIRNGKKVVNK